MWLIPLNIDEDNWDIILSMNMQTAVATLGYIKLDIYRKSFRRHWKHARESTEKSI